MPSITAPAPDLLILALDTSSSLGSVALSRGDTILAARAFEADRGHSRQLLPAIDALFTDARQRSLDVGLFAAVIGPGSFTGLRVSLACLRGLAGEKPCFGALATDVAAWAARGQGRPVLAITDLFHGEVFGAVHDDAGRRLSGHESGELDSVLTTLREFLGEDGIVVGSATVKHRAAIETAFPGITFLDLAEGLAPHLASKASVQASPSTTSHASALLPFYLRDPLTRGLLNTRPKQAQTPPK